MSKYDNEFDKIEFLEKERSYVPICSSCPSRLYVKKSIQEQRCQKCRSIENVVNFNGHTQYANYETLLEANYDLGL